MKCLLCNRYADLTKKDDCMMELCNNCLVDIKKEARKRKNENPSNHNLKISIERLLPELEQLKDELMALLAINFIHDKPVASAAPNILSLDDNIGNKKNYTDEIKKASRYKPNSSKIPNCLKFNGKIQSLHELDRKPLPPLECQYCKMPIDLNLYFYPLVILDCGHEYHRECFAKLMAGGKYKCQKCNKSFFDLS